MFCVTNSESPRHFPYLSMQWTRDMSPNELPELLPCPDVWKYNNDWSQKYEAENVSLSNVCQHSNAQFQILYFVTKGGQDAIDKIKRQNLYIKRITRGESDPWDTANGRSIEELINSVWGWPRSQFEELFEIYNAGKAPSEIQQILVEVKALIDAGKLHFEQILKHIFEKRAALATERQNARLSASQEAVDKLKKARRPETPNKHQQPSLWDTVDIKHSKVTEGFIYLLSNPLMPGIYKIGFTAANPDKRRDEVTAHYKLPVPFYLLGYWRTKDPYIVEQRIHTALSEYRRPGEFFEVDLLVAREAIETQLIPL